MKRDPHDPDEGCAELARLDAITGPFRWHDEVSILVDFDGVTSGLVNFYDLAPKGWWCKLDIISYSQAVETAIPVILEFFDPTVAGVANAPTVRILDGTAAGGIDVHHFVTTNSGNGWIVPISDNGRPWNLRCITNKGVVTTLASLDVFYRYIPRVG